MQMEISWIILIGTNLSDALISPDVSVVNEKKLERGLSDKQPVTLFRWNQGGSCLTHDPQRKDKICTGSYLVPRTVWAVFVSQRGGEREPPQVKQLFEDEIIVWLHLFTPMAQRGSASQAAQLAVLSHRWVRLVVQGHFSGEFCPFCPAAGSVITALFCTATNRPSDRQLISIF